MASKDPAPVLSWRRGGNIPASLGELNIAFRCIIAPSSPNEWINKPIPPPIYSFPLTTSANFRSVTKMNPKKLKKWTPRNRFSSLSKWKELKSHGFVLTAKKFKEPTAAYEALQMEGSRGKEGRLCPRQDKGREVREQTKRFLESPAAYRCGVQCDGKEKLSPETTSHTSVSCSSRELYKT